MKCLLQQRWRTTQSCRHKALLSSSGPDFIGKDSWSARRADRSRQRQARLHTVGLWWPRAGGPTASLCAEFRQRPANSAVGMGVRDIFKSRQLSSQSFFQKNCQGNCQVNCATTNFLQGNCQVNSFSKNFFKAIVKSILLPNGVWHVEFSTMVILTISLLH